MSKSFKMLLGAVAVGSFALVGCMNDSSTSPSSKDGFATVGVSISAPAVNAAKKAGLAKSAAFDSLVIDSLFVQLTAQGAVTGTPDTITIGVKAGSSAITSYRVNTASTGNTQATVVREGLDSVLSSNAYADQALKGFVFNLKTLRDWKIEVATISTHGDTIQYGADTVQNLYAGQIQTSTVTVSPLFASYQARFKFPSVIKSSSSSDSQTVNITRIRFALVKTSDTADQKYVVDTAAATTFSSSDTITVVYNWKAADTVGGYDSLVVEVLGKLPQANAVDTNSTQSLVWTDENVLYKQGQVLSTFVTAPNTAALTLNWMGPVRGAADLSIDIGKVGLYRFNAVTGGNVLDKRR